MSRTRSLSKMTDIQEIDAALLELQRRRKDLIAKQAERFGRFAMMAGLGDLNLSDDDCKAIFKDAAARFRAAGKGKPDQGGLSEKPVSGGGAPGLGAAAQSEPSSAD